MRLTTTHGWWYGTDSEFTRWCCKVAELAGIPLEVMEGHYGRLLFDPEKPEAYEMMPVEAREQLVDIFKCFPLKWEALRPDILHVLLYHSEFIAAEDCGPLAERLAEIVDLMPDEDAGGDIGFWKAKTQEFVDGLRLVASRGESVVFDYPSPF